MAGHARSWGEMRAINIYGNSIEIGNLDVDAYSLGAYWTHSWEDEAYFDAIVMHSWLRIDTESVADYSSCLHGMNGWSLEADKKFSISEKWVIEPQAQIYWQYQQPIFRHHWSVV